jgi:BirA family biotin operon repressor/biotin-[acetyl-CoA-carboxylase] ligase
MTSPPPPDRPPFRALASPAPPGVGGKFGRGAKPPSDRRFGAIVHALGEVDSTQAVARALADDRAPEGTVVTAEHQRAGRGRGGRSWLDRPGEALLCSVVLRPAIDAAEVPQLALLAAVALAEAVEALTGLAPGIKWPNDLVVEDRKLAGILAEAATDGRAVTRVILGMGINVSQREFPVDLAARATSLALLTGRAVDRGALLDGLLTRLEYWYDISLDHGFKPLHAEWCRRTVTLGRTVVAGGVQGTAVGLDHDGALLVRDAAHRTHRVVAGEVLDAPGG